MLSGLSLQSFKAFGKAIHLNLKPLTILVGENGCGKSGILEARCYISRAYSDPLLLNGEFVNFPSYEVIFHQRKITLPMKLAMNILSNETERQTIHRSLIDADLCSLATDYDTHTEIGYEYVYSFPKGYVDRKDYTVKQTLTVTNQILAETSRESLEGQFVERIRIPFYEEEIQPNKETLGFFLSPLPFQIVDSRSNTFNKLTEVLIGCFRRRLQNKIRILYSTRGAFPHSISSYGEEND